MADTQRDTKSGATYRDLIAAYCARNYGGLGITVYTEVPAGTTIIGKRRQVDVVLARGSIIFTIECKFQDVSGTADEKIPYALADLESPWTPGCLVYAGDGWSKGVKYMLQSSHRAACVLPGIDLLRGTETEELDFMVSAVFGLWNELLPPKRIFDPGTASAVAERFHVTRHKRTIAKQATQSKRAANDE